MAAAEFDHYSRLRNHMLAESIDPEEAMRPFVGRWTASTSRPRRTTG
jgi:hypothetical protein